MSSDPKSVMMAWVDGLNSNDPDAVAACFATDSVFTDIGTGQHAEGSAAMREIAVGFLGMFTDLRIEKTNFLESEGGHCATEWIMTGVHAGDVPGLPATGRSFRVAGACVGEVRDGKIVNATEYWNMADFLTQVGLLPAC
jgi:steroid delta-isomerase-like uncharacterized protein